MGDGSGGDGQGEDATRPVSRSSTPSGRASTEPASSAVVAEAKRGEVIGDRYAVLEPLGEGGMGVVYLARDLRLERRVALKVLKRRPGSSPKPDALARLLREAQALARLTDPHVVPAYDVRWQGEDLVVAMEYVPGRPLSVWLKGQPPWPRIIDAFVQAGRGLAAAHAAGLVHRDFKPDNAIIGDDGRVRVLDFGLARVWGSRSRSTDDDPPTPSAGSLGSLASGDELTDAGIVLGTPMYMSPEQLFGGEVGPASDQYNYCVALYRALYRHLPFAGMSVEEVARNKTSGRVLDPATASEVPRTIAAVVRRGLAPAAADRFASMDALVAALARAARPRSRRGLVVAGLAVGTLAVAGALWSWPTRCPDPQARLDEVWGSESRDALVAAFARTGAGFAESTATRVVERLDGYAAAWLSAQHRACAAAPADPVVRDCLAARLDRLAGTLDVLRDTSDATALERSVDVVAALPSIDACEDPAARVREELPADPGERARVAVVRGLLAEAEAHRAAGRVQAATARARAALADAEQIGFAPLQLEAGLLLGHVLSDDARFEEAEQRLEAAAHAASAAGRDDLVVAATTLLVVLVGDHLARVEDGLAWARHGEAAMRRTEVSPRARARLLGRTGSLLVTAARFDEGRDAIEEALAVARAELPDDDPILASLLYDLGTLETSQGRFDAGIELIEDALARKEAYFGPDHPAVAGMLAGLGRAEYGNNDFVAANRHFRRAVEIKEAAFGPMHPSLAVALANLAGTERVLEHYDEARRLYERALEIAEHAYGPDHDRVAQVLVNLGGLEYVQGEYERARGLFERSLSITERTLGPRHPSVATVANNLGLLYDTMGDHARAAEVLGRALAIRLEALPADHPVTALTHVNLEQSHNRSHQYERGAPHGLEAIRIFEARRDPKDPELAYALTVHGENRLFAGAADEALPLLQRAAEIYVDARFEPASTSRARFSLARARWQAGGDRSVARGEAQTARDGYVRAGEQLYAAELADIDAWLTTHAPP